MVKSSGRLHPARIGSNTTSVCTEGSPSSRAHADNDYAVVPLITAYAMEGRQRMESTASAVVGQLRTGTHSSILDDIAVPLRAEFS
jgi:hypothetical protein